MDLSNSETTPSDILMKYYSKNAPFYSTYRRQAFPFRDTLIHYITNNPSTPGFYQKVIQSCKHFFIKNPIIIFPKLCYNQKEGWYIQKSRPSNDHPAGRKIYLNKITSKIWITDSLDVGGNTRNLPVTGTQMRLVAQRQVEKLKIKNKKTQIFKHIPSDSMIYRPYIKNLTR